MNSKKGCTKSHGKSRQKELHKLFEMYDLIVSREDLHELYQREVGEFVEGITMLGIKAVIDAEVERRCGKPHDRSGECDCYRHGKQKGGRTHASGAWSFMYRGIGKKHGGTFKRK